MMGRRRLTNGRPNDENMNNLNAERHYTNRDPADVSEHKDGRSSTIH